MSAKPEVSAPAYNDAERGTLDVDQRQAAIVVALPFTEERKVDPTLAVTKEVIPQPTKASKPPAPKRKVSKWILWTLWFNTYR